MAMANLATTYTAWWQGLSIERWGYPVTLAIDSAAGLIVLLLLPLMKPAAQETESER
jgi:predicted MFS family arabinose efflux permease